VAGDRSFEYRLDGRDRVEHVSPAWLAFARENDAAELTRDRVIGRPLWSFVRGMEVQSVYRALFRDVRERGIPLAIPFRCDSPGERREMELEVAPGDGGALKICGRLLRVRPRTYLALLDSMLPRDGEARVELCSFCKRLHIRGRGWFEADELPACDHGNGLPALDHGLCDDCAAACGASLA
jgi:hypothetical protein